MPRKLIAFIVAGAVLPAAAAAPDELVAELTQRLSAQGVEHVNAHLGTHGADAMAFNDSVARCHLQAVSLSIQLARGSRSKVVDAHKESLRVAVGRCTGFVLALLSPKEVPAVCSSAGSWTLSQMARELRRRIKRIEADESLRESARGQACRAAYVYELQNTRVGLRVGPPRASSPGR